MTLHQTHSKTCHKNDVTLPDMAVIDLGLLSFFYCLINIAHPLPACSLWVSDYMTWGLLTWPIHLRHHSTWLMPPLVVTIYQFSLSCAPPLALFFYFPPPFLSSLCPVSLMIWKHITAHVDSPSVPDTFSLQVFDSSRTEDQGGTKKLRCAEWKLTSSVG